MFIVDMSMSNHTCDCFCLLVRALSHGHPQDFFQWWANYGSGDENPLSRSRDGAPVGIADDRM